MTSAPLKRTGADADSDGMIPARQVGVALVAVTAALGAAWLRRTGRQACRPPTFPVRTLADAASTVVSDATACATVAATPTRVAVAAVYSASTRSVTR